MCGVVGYHNALKMLFRVVGLDLRYRARKRYAWTNRLAVIKTCGTIIHRSWQATGLRKRIWSSSDGSPSAVSSNRLLGGVTVAAIAVSVTRLLISELLLIAKGVDRFELALRLLVPPNS